MALISCLGCKKRISEYAADCPSCGLSNYERAPRVCPECDALTDKILEACNTCGYPFDKSRSTYEEIGHETINKFSEAKSYGSEFVEIVEDMTTECVNHACDTHMPTGNFRVLLRSVEIFLGDLIYIAVQVNPDDERLWWVHDSDLATNSVQSERLNRRQLYRSAQEYLGLPIRAQKCDRFLVEVSIAVEYSAYSFEALHKLHKLPDFVKGLKRRSSRELFLALESRIKQTKATEKEEAIKIISAMNDAYCLLETEELISCKHLESVVYEASRKGAVWPPVLYHLLEDINSRSGKL